MDAGKRKTLIEWVNSLAVAECIESLLQLHDGRHVLALTNLVEGIPQQSDVESKEKRWELIRNFLEGLYQCTMTGKIDTKAIVQECAEFEIAKVCLLVMSAAMLCERNLVFVDRAMRLEVALQHEVREMVEFVIQPNRELSDIDPCFQQVLTQRLDICAFEMKELNPQASSTPQSCNQRSRTGQTTSTPTMNLNRVYQQVDIGTTPVFSTSILGRFTSPGPSQGMSPMSPVQQMVQSPNMANKIRMQQKEQRIKLLERELNSKRHLVAEYEAEIEDKRKEVDDKEKSMADVRDRFQQALRKITQLQAEVEDLRQLQDVSMQQTSDYERLHLLKTENTGLVQRNKQLEDENSALFEKIQNAEAQASHLQEMREEMAKYLPRLQQSEGTVCSLRAALDDKNQLVAQLSEATERAHAELQALRTTHHQELLDMREKLESVAGGANGAGESLGGVVEIKFMEELEALKGEISEYEQKLQEKADCVLELIAKNDQLSNESIQLSSHNGILHNEVEQLSERLNICQKAELQSQERSAMWEKKANELETTIEEIQNISRIRIEELEAQAAALSTENQSNISQLSASQEAARNLQAAMQGLEATLNSLRQEYENACREFEEKFKAHQIEKSHLEDQFKIESEKLAHATEVQTEKTAEHQEEIKTVRSEAESRVRALEEDIGQRKLQFEEQEKNLLQQIETAAKSHNAYMSQLEEQRSETQKLAEVKMVLEEEIKKHESRNASLEQDLNLTKGALEEKETGLSEAQNELCVAKSRCGSLEEDVKQHKKIAEEQKLELSRQLEVATLSGDEQSAAVQRLSLQLREASMKADSAESALEDLRNESNEKERQWNSKVDEFEKTVGEICELRQQLQENEVELRQLGSQCDQVSQQLQDTEKTRDAFMSRVQEQETIMTDLNEKLLESETQSEERSTKVDVILGQLKALKEEKVQIRQELDAECERVEAMEMELMETQQTAEMKEQEMEVKFEEACLARESLESELSTVRAKTQSMEEHIELQNKKMTTLCENLKLLSAEDQQRQQELTAALEIRQRVMEQLDEAQYKIMTLQEELEDSRERNSALETMIEDHKNNAERFEAHLKEFMEEKVGEISTLETELTDTDDKLKQSKAQVKELCSQLESAQDTIQSLQKDRGDQASTISSLETSLTLAQEAFFNTEKEKEEVQQNLMQSRMSLSGKQDHLGAMQEKVAKLKEELSASNECVKQLQNNLSVYEQKSADIERKLQDAESEAERKEMKLESDLERSEEEVEELNEKISVLVKMHTDSLEIVKQKDLALEESRFKETNLHMELLAIKQELLIRQEALQNMEVHQAGQLEKVLTDGNVVCREYEQKIYQAEEHAKAMQRTYEAQMQEVSATLQETQSVAEEKVKSYCDLITKLKDEHKEEVKVLGRQIESLSAELQNLKCWEISERSSIKELEKKCQDLEEEVAKSQKEKVIMSLKLQSTEKQIDELEESKSEEKTTLEEQINSMKQLETEVEEVKSQLLKAEAQYTEELCRLEIERKETIANLEEERLQAIEGYQQVCQELEDVREELEAAKQHHHQELVDLEERCMEVQDIMENQVQRSSESAADKQSLVKKHEEYVAQLKDEHFENVAELELNYQLEVERLEAELEKNKSDLAHKQELLVAVQEKAASAQNDAHAELIGLEKDKLDLETKLESVERTLKVTKDDNKRSMRFQEIRIMELVEEQHKVRHLEREIQKMMEREKRHLEAHRRETSLGADMNAKLQQRLAELETELSASHEKYNHEVRELTGQVSIMQDKYKEELEHLEQKNNEQLDQEISTWRSKFEQLSVTFNKLEDRHAKSEEERQRLVESTREAQSGKDMLKDQVKLLEKELSTVKAERDHSEEQLHEASNLKNQVREEEMLNKRLANQVRSLEVQLDHATRQLKADGRQRSLVPPPQPPPFPETPASLRRSLRNANSKETTFDSNTSPKSSPEDEFAKPYDLRSTKTSNGEISLKDLTVTPGIEGRYMSRLSFAGSMGPTPQKSPSSSSTGIGSERPNGTRSESSRSLRLSISSNSSHESTRSSNVPFGTGSLFSMEDEPVEFEWDRISELQRRNTLCLPHLKSSYPTEVQTVGQKRITETDLQKGEPLEQSESEAIDTRSKARKRNSTEAQNIENTTRRKTLAGPELSKSSTSTLNGSSGVSLKVYPHYSPRHGGTPQHKLARSSPRGATPTKKNTKTKTATPKQVRVTTPKQSSSRKGTPFRISLRSKAKENTPPKTKNSKAPMSFNIGFTPKVTRRLPQILRRKKGSTTNETPKVKQAIIKHKNTKPLGDHNGN